jgi:hypothetical protein
MAAPAYLLDTGIVLLATRAGNASKVIDAQVGLGAMKLFVLGASVI